VALTDPDDRTAPSLRRPLLVTADPDLLDDLLRLTAAAGVEPEVAADPVSARRGWAAAPLVLVGDDLTAEVAASGPARRPAVVVVGTDLDDAGVWRRALAVGAEHVVLLPDGQRWLVDRLAEAAEGAARGAVACVLGGRGGAGATTLAVALALAGQRRGLGVVLVDADPLGGGIDLVLGAEDAAGLRWPDLAGTSGRVSPGALRSALPSPEGLTVLSWDRGDLPAVPVAAMTAVLDSAPRGADLVVVDLPRHLDAAAETALARSDVGYLVVPAEVRATAAAARVAAAAALSAADLRVVVRGPAPTGLPAQAVAAALGLPLAGEARAEPGLAAALDRGDPPGVRRRGPLARLAAGLLDDLLGPARSRAA
jgi:secretion/DNA translocation related CpaE-like protein